MTGPALIHDDDMPTPYGVLIKTYRRADLPPEDDAAWVLDAEGSALLAGIYDPAERKRFAEETKRQTQGGPGMRRVKLRIEEFGGHKVPRLPLPRPDRPLYPQMPGKDLTPVEAWATGMMDHARWHERATFFDGILAENMAQIGACTDDAAAIYPAALATI